VLPSLPSPIIPNKFRLIVNNTFIAPQYSYSTTAVRLPETIEVMRLIRKSPGRSESFKAYTKSFISNNESIILYLKLIIFNNK